MQVFNGPAIPAHAQAGICQQPASINIRQTPKLIYPIDLHFDQPTSQYVGTNSDGKTAFPATAQVSIDSDGSFAMSISVQNGYTGSYSGTVTGGTVKGTIELIERLKGDVVGLAFLVELDFLKGRDRLDRRRVTSVIKY